MTKTRANRHALLASLAALAAFAAITPPAAACCPAPPPGKPAVNADQTVILVWDPATKTEHFVRRASFKAESADFGFLVPTPAQPELAESGDDAFPFFEKVTEPEVRKVPAPASGGCASCAGESKSAAVMREPPPQNVKVLEEKAVAGFQAVVLEATSATALVGWLKERGYAFSPEVEAWAKPYVDGGWKITALRVAKDDAKKSDARVAAASLRLSFKTDAPLFPYREPDPKGAQALTREGRLLRFYFLSDARYDGSLVGATWTGKTAWAGPLTAEQRARALDLLRLPAGSAGPPSWYLTELEDPWPYRVHPSDLTFARSATQELVRRPPILEYVSTDATGRRDGTALAVVGLLLAPAMMRRLSRRPKG
jgi:hypothetical protein